MGQRSETKRPTGATASAGNHLKLALVVGDAVSIGIASAATLALAASAEPHSALGALIVTMTAVVAGLWAVHSQGLHLARVSAVRAIELSRAARAAAILGASMLLADRVLHLGLRLRGVAIASAATLVLLCVWRSIFRSSMTRARSEGRRLRRVVVIGAGDDAARMIELCATHPEVGFSVVGVVGDAVEATVHGLSDLWLGEVADIDECVVAANVSGVFVTAGSVPVDEMKPVLRSMHALNLHVHFTTGICGLDSRRIRLLPLAHEPLLYLEPSALSRKRIVAKRCFDVVVASLLLIVLSPIMLAIAVAIRLVDGGPVFFVQNRIGRNGTVFGVLKFRTMCVDAERRLAELRQTNERSGPLFKMVSDPRVTRIGRFLRESSLDELPQLINVLRGEMSLVGPRPALPAEVALFSDDLRSREKVLPGITGLWQVEARDNPSFTAYQRLDLFYVENWSLGLDVVILARTALSVVCRPSRVRRSQPDVIVLD